MTWIPEADTSYGAKQEVIRGYWQQWGPFRYAVETGIYQGKGSLQQFAGECSYVAVEINDGYAGIARHAGFDTRTGDAAELLASILTEMDAPAFFWLDAHLVTSPDSQEQGSSLYRELAAIIAWPYAAKSVVLADDLGMLGLPAWPTQEQLAGLDLGVVWHVDEADDVLRLTPRR